MKFTQNQVHRLQELGTAFDPEQDFDSARTREEVYKEHERTGRETNLHTLLTYKSERRAPAVNELAWNISSFLRDKGFIEVSTPLIISKTFLERMTIDDEHALYKQVFWLDQKTCLRPMLAPNLYDVSKRLLNVYDAPLGVFEVGPCFRKESQGGRHLESFTMVNYVEWGVREDQKRVRFDELASSFMHHIGLESYAFEEEDSVVYGDTVDIMVDDVEIASGAFGPHPLDSKWGMDTTWLGLGAGLERIVMLKEGLDTIQKAGRSLRYLGGASLAMK